MEAIYIPQLLKAPDRTEELLLEDFIPGLKTLTPIRGRLVVRHGGTFLDISLQAETIITLACDRCLKQYNHRLAVDTSELIWLDDNANQEEDGKLEREVPVEDLSETLPPDGYFHPETWLYEQLCLALPLRQLCDENCQQPATISSKTDPLMDSRWASLAALKEKLSQ
jgi:uncharacterized protein